MAERICGICGTKNGADARFCTSCDNYLGWDAGTSTLDGEPLTGTVPVIVEKVPAQPGPPVGAPPQAATPDATGPGAVPERVDGASLSGQPGEAAGGRGHGSPGVTVANPEVVVAPHAPAEVQFTVENTMNIVDGYVLEAVDPPAWLTVAHPDVHLMPGEVRSVALSLGMQEQSLVVAQRVALEITVRSMEDPARRASVGIVVTVPPHGPRPTLEARPALLRLHDAESGELSLLLDNRAANYPQTFGMSGSDPEGAVTFTFTPAVVQLPAGSMVEVPATFTAPRPAPGQQLTRQLTLTATNDEGPITTPVTLVQSTAAAPVDAPIRVQLEPSTIRLEDRGEAEFDVHVDNRGGHSAVTVALSGTDPEHRLSFAFVPARFVAAPGQITRASGRVRAPLPPRGTTVTHPFSVVSSDGKTDATASASLEVASSAAAVTTAQLRVLPEKLDIGTRSAGEFSVEVDNRRGTEPLNVVLAAQSDDGLLRARFTPPRLTVGAGALGHARASVSAPHPPPGKVVTRRVEVRAAEGAQSLQADAEVTQTGPDRRRPTGRWLVVLGVLLILIGALRLPWLAGTTLDLDVVGLPGKVIGTLQTGGFGIQSGVELAEAPLRILLAVMAATMLFGLAGNGGLIRKTAVLVALLSIGYVVAAGIEASSIPALDLGIPIVLAGAVLGYIGGVLIRPAERG